MRRKLACVLGLLGFLLLSAGMANAAALVSADVSITGATTASGTGVAPGGSLTGTGCVANSGHTCDYVFTLTTTGFTFQEFCTPAGTTFCSIAATTVTLSSLSFNPVSFLTNATLIETALGPDGAGDVSPAAPWGSIQTTANSLILSIVAFGADCGGGISEAVTFVTSAIDTSNVSEPASLTLMAAGLAGLAWRRRRRHAAA